VSKLGDTLKSPFSFLFPRSRKMELMAEYVIREHRRGRSIAEILDDPHVRNNLSQDQADRLLDRPDVLHAIGADIVAAHRSQV
jgi:hypothetical protein